MGWGSGVIGAMQVFGGICVGDHQAIQAQRSRSERGRVILAWSAEQGAIVFTRGHVVVGRVEW